jgi:hypothetical protein
MVGHATLIDKFELMQTTDSASDRVAIAIAAENEKLAAGLAAHTPTELLDRLKEHYHSAQIWKGEADKMRAAFLDVDRYRREVRAHLGRVKKELFAAKGRVKELESGKAFSVLLSQVAELKRLLRRANSKAERNRINSANRERAARDNARYWKAQCELANEQARSQLGVGSSHTAMAVDCAVAPPVDAPDTESIATLSLRISALERGLEKSRRGS